MILFQSFLFNFAYKQITLRSVFLLLPVSEVQDVIIHCFNISAKVHKAKLGINISNNLQMIGLLWDL